MAHVLKVFCVIISLAVWNIHAAALQTSDLDTTDGDQVASSYQPIEPEPSTVNQSSVVIDLYTPETVHESRQSVSAEKPASPSVQFFINQPDADASGPSTEANQMIDNNTTPSSLQLIPPALVNASIDKLEDSKRRQGQIIIRYANFQFKLRNVTRFRHYQLSTFE